MSCKVGNQTNSQDPQAVNSRVFVGNLNTFQCSKTDVERRFQRYGRIAGISMHKGYAFIQFTNPFDARSACLGEDARLLWGQTLDVNMVAEPKSHQTGRKRQNIAKTGNDWDYYYDSLKVQLESVYHSYYAQVGFPTPRLVPPMKRPRIHLPLPCPPVVATTRPPRKVLPSNKAAYYSNTSSLSDLKSYSTPDILICGNCRELYSDVEQLMEHKKSYCKLRFTCKCHTRNGCTPKSLGEEPASLLCSQCKDSFHTAWDLMVHVQAAHMLNIYQLGDDTKTTEEDQTEGIEEENENGVGGEGVPTNEVGTLLNDMDGMVNSHGENHNSENNSFLQPMAMSTSHGHSLVEESNGNENGNVEEDADGDYVDVKLDLHSVVTTTPGTPEGGVQPKSHHPVSPIFTFPMEASTQTQEIEPEPTRMDNPNNFDEPQQKQQQEQHCSLGATMKEMMEIGVQFPFGITPKLIENKTA